MATFTRAALSGAANGLGVKVVATATAGTTIHTAPSGTTSFDEVWLWAYNGHTADVVLTIEHGGVTVPDNNIVLTIPFKSGLVAVGPGLVLQNSLLVRAFAATANVIVLSGYINRITL